MGQAVLFSIDEEKNQKKAIAKISDEVSIGSSDNADIHIINWKCNGIHALIQRKDDGDFALIDLGSYYGTSVNGKPIINHNLSDGDELKIGDDRFVIEILSNDLKHNEVYVDQKKEDDHQAKQYKKKSAYSLKSEKNILEVGMYWGEQLLEVFSFEQGQSITIGHPKLSTFDIPLAHPDYQGKNFKLATYKGGQLLLQIPKEANGIVWTDNKTTAFDTLRLYDDKHKGKNDLDLKLRIGDRAHMEFGELSLTFKFVSPAEDIPLQFVQRPDSKLFQLFAGILGLYLLIGMFFSVYEPELKERTLKDIPKHLKKTVYQAGIERAKKRNKAAIGELREKLAGRAKSEEGASKAKQAPKKQEKKEVSKKKKAVAKAKSTTPKKRVTSKTIAKKKTTAQAPVKLDLDTAFATSTDSSSIASKTTIISKVSKDGNTASALTENGFARGKVGLGSGGGGQSVGIGALKGSNTGGGLGAGDYGLSPNKGVQIRIPEIEDISIQDGLDPDIIAARIKKYIPQVRHCYEQRLIKKPKLRGKITASFVILGNGGVGKVGIADSSLNDGPAESCIKSKIKNWTFPKPKGGGTVGVKYPFILMSNTGK